MRASAPPTPRRPGSGPALAALGLLVALVALTALRSLPPAAVGVDAPLASFSAARARATLERLVDGTQARAAGSAAAAAFRERLQDELRRLGLEPIVERSWACSPEGSCAEVANVLARIPNGGNGADAPAVLLMAHTDSVAAGPGAADDATGVAGILECARALLAAPERASFARPITLLFTDAEEPGLLGAEAYVRARGAAGLAREVAAVINLEARGTAGLDFLFETGEENAGLLGAVGGELPRPAASSLFYEIYRRLPNDTDFSVFKRAGVAGLNFAFIGEPLRYHTPRDEARLLDSGSLQHQGDHALAATRALATASPLSAGPGRAVFFDLFGFTLLSWPESWSLPLAVVGLFLVLLAAWRSGRSSPLGALAGLGALLATLATAASAGWAVHALLSALGAFPFAWVAHLEVATLAFFTLGATAALVPRLFRRVPEGSLWTGTWIGWGLLALALAGVAPGASHLAIVPLLVAGSTGLATRSVTPGPLSIRLPMLAAGALWLPLAWSLPVAMGHGMLVAVAAMVALVATPAAESFSTVPARRPLAALTVVTVALGAATLALPRFTPERPQPASLRFVDLEGDHGRETLWVVDPPRAPLPAGLARLAPFTRRATLPWSRAKSFAAPAAAIAGPALAPPQIESLSSERSADLRRLRLRLRSPRGASRAALWLPKEADLREATIASVAVPVASGRLAGVPREGRLLVIATLPPEGVEIELVLGDRAPGTTTEATVMDLSPGLPPAGDAFAAARGASAVPFGLGDATLVLRRLRL